MRTIRFPIAVKNPAANGTKNDEGHGHQKKGATQHALRHLFIRAG
jgi:hypothetical protein